MLKVPPPTRVALGTLQVGGQKFELFLSLEWARYFESLNTDVLAAGAALAQSNALTALLDDAREEPDVLPAPPGPRGMQGDPGLALFMLQDDARDEAVLVPPCVDGVYVPLNTKDASNGVPGLTGFNLNLKNALGTVTSWIASIASVPRTWTLPDKNGTVALTSDFAAPPAIGNVVPAAGNFTTLAASGASTLAAVSATTLTASGTSTLAAVSATAGSFITLTASGGFGCNGKAAQAPAASGGTLAGVIAALVANGILSS